MKTPSLVRPRCPHSRCSSHGPGQRRAVIRHARLTTLRGTRIRYLCRGCGRTFVGSHGTPYHRMRRSRSDFDRAMQLVSDGVPKAAVARAQCVSSSTVGRWIERAARHAQRFDEEHLKLDDAVEVQLDELDSHGAGERDPAWVFGAIEVWSRVWVATRVSRRTLRATLVFLRRIRAVLVALSEPVLVTSDEFKYYPPVVKRVLGPHCVHVQVTNRYRRDRILRTESRLVLGTERQLERARARSEDSRKANTSYIERLNLFIRRACAYLQRRTPGAARNPQRLEDALTILRAYYNFIRPHSSLRFGKLTRTPAMQAGLFDRPLRFRDIFSWVPPPPRPQPKLVEFR